MFDYRQAGPRRRHGHARAGQLLERRNVIEDVKASCVGGNDQIVVAWVDGHIHNRKWRQPKPQVLPGDSLIERMSNFSMATGDFKIFSGTLEAVTTTSFPKTVCVANATCSCEPSAFTSTSCGAKPTEVNNKVKGSFCFVLKVK